MSEISRPHSSNSELRSGALWSIVEEKEVVNCEVKPSITKNVTRTYKERSVPDIVELAAHAELSPSTNTSHIDTCTTLLKNSNVGSNRLGLRFLVLLSQSRDEEDGPALKSELCTSIVYGGECMSKSERLRNAFLPFLAPSTDNDDWSSSTSSSDDNDEWSQYSKDGSTISGVYHDDDDVEETKHDQSDNANDDLHVLALRVFVYSLQEIVSAKKRSSIEVSDPTWARILSSLGRDIESCRCIQSSEYALRSLRLLQILEPWDVTPLLGQSLLPYLANQQQLGKANGLPIIEKVASKLLHATRRGIC